MVGADRVVRAEEWWRPRRVKKRDVRIDTAGELLLVLSYLYIFTWKCEDKKGFEFWAHFRVFQDQRQE